MSELEKLKKVLLGGQPTEQERIYSLCAVMEIVGGYDQLMNLPLPALNHILKYLEHVNKKTKEGMPKKVGRR